MPRMNIQDIEGNIRKEASSALKRIILFLFYYFFLILLGIGLLAGMTWITILLIDVLGHSTRIHSPKAYFIMIIIWAAMWWFCLQLSWYLIKPLFVIHKPSHDNYKEIQTADCPELFAVIRELAKSTGNAMPKHVYLSAELNACVFYNSVSLWSILFPTPKNLMIGTGLLHGFSQDELKAILAHEFGHFSQKTMKIGVITSRLMSIIETMVEYAGQEIEKAERSKIEKQVWWQRLFYAASGIMSKLNKLTIKFYNSIGNKYYSLSRYMEFEADSIACRTAGTDVFYSSLCKLEALYERHSTYQDIVDNLLSDKRYLYNYDMGYDTMMKLYNSDEEHPISYNQMLHARTTDAAKYPSRVKVIDNWDSHPTIIERLECITQIQGAENTKTPQDAALWASEALRRDMGLFYQRHELQQIDPDYAWDEMQEMAPEDFDQSLTVWFNKKHTPHFLVPFTNLTLKIKDKPSDEELATPIESPLSPENRDMLLRYQADVDDWLTLKELNESSTKHVLFDGKECSDIKQAMRMLDDLIQSNSNERVALNRNLYIYLSQKNGQGEELWQKICATTYADDQLPAIREAYDMVQEILEKADTYEQRGETYYVDAETKQKLHHKLTTFLKGLDYNSLEQWCGEWCYNNVPVSESMKRWRDYAAQPLTQKTVVQEMLDLTKEVYTIIKELSSDGVDYWKEQLRQAIKS